MCGFLCIVGKDLRRIVSDEKLIKASKKHIHRGPDSQDHYIENEFKCYFRRLSIIDLNKRSNQPFHSEDGRYVMLFNGEIYNFKILKKELISLGQKFYTEGDTEVLIRSFQTWGKKFIKKIRGMFSICIWDKKLKKFFAYRDRFGIKPLYYTKYKNSYFFSSEIKDIVFLLKEKKFKENKKIIKNYLANSFLNDTEETFLSEIKSVKPGYLVEISNLNISFERYWKLKYSEKNDLNRKEIIQKFSESLELHNISDVPIAYTLSGGIDSSLITGISKNFKNFDKNTKFFSIIPKNTVDESFWINSTVKKFNLNHYYIKSKKKNFDDYKKFINFQDEPVQTASAYYQYLLRKKIKDHKIKVLMVGEGADEVYGGYRRSLYYYLKFLNLNRKDLIKFISLSSIFMQNTVNKILTDYLKYKNTIDNGFSDIEDLTYKKLLNYKNLNKYFLDIPENSNNFFKDALISHMTKRDLPYVLRMEDRSSMSQSIEARVPFLDHEMIEYAYSIKTEYFMKNAQNKYILRNCFKKFFSKEVLKRKVKSASPGDNSIFIFNDFYGDFIDLLNSKYQNNYFDKKLIKFNLEKDKKNKVNTNANLYFRIFNYLVWQYNQYENFN